MFFNIIFVFTWGKSSDYKFCLQFWILPVQLTHILFQIYILKGICRVETRATFTHPFIIKIPRQIGIRIWWWRRAIPSQCISYLHCVLFNKHFRIFFRYICKKFSQWSITQIKGSILPQQIKVKWYKQTYTKRCSYLFYIQWKIFL